MRIFTIRIRAPGIHAYRQAYTTCTQQPVSHTQQPLRWAGGSCAYKQLISSNCDSEISAYPIGIPPRTRPRPAWTARQRDQQSQDCTVPTLQCTCIRSCCYLGSLSVVHTLCFPYIGVGSLARPYPSPTVIQHMWGQRQTAVDIQQQQQQQLLVDNNNART